jgi:hypothetical protein
LKTNLLTKLTYKQMSHIFVLSVSQKFVANQFGFATNLPRQLCEQVCHQVCCKNVMVETHLYTQHMKTCIEGQCCLTSVNDY